MAALFAALSNALQTSFTANTSANSVTLASPSSLAGLYVGLPVVGGSVPEGATIATLSPALTLSLPALATATGVALLSGVMTFGRRVVPWSEVAAQPALFLRDGAFEELEYLQGILQRQTLRAEIWLYSDAGTNPDAVPASAINALLDAVQSVLAPDDPQSGRYTIGGLVEWCRMEGRVDKDPGDISGQAMAVADVLITVP